MRGIERLWPELHNALERSYCTEECDPAELSSATYVCVRPGAGEPFTIQVVNDCIDVRAAGGAGNSICGGAALLAFSKGLKLIKNGSSMLFCKEQETFTNDYSRLIQKIVK